MYVCCPVCSRGATVSKFFVLVINVHIIIGLCIQSNVTIHLIKLQFTVIFDGACNWAATMRKHIFWHMCWTKIQIRMHSLIRGIVVAWRNFASLGIQNAPSEDSDQTVRWLSWIFVGRQKVHFLYCDMWAWWSISTETSAYRWFTRIKLNKQSKNNNNNNKKNKKKNKKKKKKKQSIYPLRSGNTNWQVLTYIQHSDLLYWRCCSVVCRYQLVRTWHKSV